MRGGRLETFVSLQQLRLTALPFFFFLLSHVFDTQTHLVECEHMAHSDSCVIEA